ncbi:MULTISPECIES: fimbria/pilus outer membrane usher protein [Pseudomonas syringae group]|uniref:Beta-fimbriae usher protein n=1 Tax=Pseudomonas syringae pv. ribicola TaxID=55398 RepID=A0A3M2VXY0_PSESI|nr:fimbria/pilus outer membrane usher protein [Pseudomonas syringae group genomosp. 3]RML44161.1 Beta-fimbriae usher protein [Pseudomonas syringae pv. ribicola]
MKPFHFLLLIFFMSMNAQAQLKFDNKLLGISGISDQQVEDALHDKELYAGENSVHLYVNDRLIAKTVVYATAGGRAGYTAHDLQTFGLKKEAWGQRIKNGAVTYVQLTDRVKPNFSRSDRSLKLVVPRALLENPDFIQQQKGGTGAFVNYNTYYSTFTSPDSSSNSLSTTYQVGANADNALLRANGTFSSFTSRTQRYSNNNLQSFYLDRDFDVGRVKAGRLNSPDGGFGVGYVDGVIYNTKDAPSGVGSVAFRYDSDAPAVIEFYQRDQLVYTLNVNRGHNNLAAIPVTSLTSDVVVVVKRDGQVIDTRQISRARISRATTQSSGLYAFAGRSNTDAHAVTAGAGYSKRYSDAVNPTVAVVAQQRYQGVSLSNTFDKGGVQMTTYGLLSRNERNKLGFNLNTTLSYGGTDLTYQAISKNFSYVGQALYDDQANIKSSLGISRSFVVGDDNAFSLSFNRYNFYNQASYSNWSAGYSTNIKKTSFTVSAGYAPQAPGDTLRDKMTLNASLSIPFEVGGRHVYYRSQYNAYSNSQRLDNYLTARINSDYSVTAGHVQRTAERTETTENYISNDFNTPYTHAGLTVSKSESDSRSATSNSLSLSGSIAANRKGVVFTPQQLKETYAVVDTHLKGFVKVSSQRSSAITNYNGKVVLANISDNKADFVKVNPKGLDDGVYFQNNQVDFISDRGAVSYFDFEPTSNKTVLLHWTNRPKALNARTVFYDKDGNLIASFIDQDVLLVNQDNVKQLQTLGMFAASDSTLMCKLPTQLEISNEQIIDTTFDCSRQKIPLAGLPGSHAPAG